jgi:hypothetical protein
MRTSFDTRVGPSGEGPSATVVAVPVERQTLAAPPGIRHETLDVGAV